MNFWFHTNESLTLRNRSMEFFLGGGVLWEFEPYPVVLIMCLGWWWGPSSVGDQFMALCKIYIQCIEQLLYSLV